MGSLREGPTGDLIASTLAELQVANAVAAEADRLLRASVRSAREAGATWEQVGLTLGVKKQSAWEKYWRDAGPTHNK